MDLSVTFLCCCAAQTYAVTPRLFSPCCTQGAGLSSVDQPRALAPDPAGCVRAVGLLTLHTEQAALLSFAVIGSQTMTEAAPGRPSVPARVADWGSVRRTPDGQMIKGAFP